MKQKSDFQKLAIARNNLKAALKKHIDPPMINFLNWFSKILK